MATLTSSGSSLVVSTDQFHSTPSSLKLSGSNHAVISGLDSRFTNTSWTLEFFARHTSLGGSQQYYIANGTGNFSGMAISWHPSTQLTLNLGRAQGAWDIANQGNLATLSANTWYHVALVYDGAAGQYRLYHNGTLVFTQASDVNNRTSLQSLVVGARDRNSALGLVGFIDDLRVSNTAIYTGSSISVPSTPYASASTTTYYNGFSGTNNSTTIPQGVSSVSARGTPSSLLLYRENLPSTPLRYSADGGVTWDDCLTNGLDITWVARVPTGYIGAPRARSTDGITWTQDLTLPPSARFKYVYDRVIGFDPLNSNIYVSTDGGTTWSGPRNALGNANDIVSNADGSLFVLQLGETFTVRTTDFVNFTDVKRVAFDLRFLSLVFLNGKFNLYGNDGRHYSSTDGSNWTLISNASAVPSTIFPRRYGQSVAVKSSNEAVAVGPNGGSIPSSNVSVTTNGGTSWSSVNTTNSTTFARTDVEFYSSTAGTTSSIVLWDGSHYYTIRMAYINNAWRNTVWRSANGVDWTFRSVLTNVSITDPSGDTFMGASHFILTALSVQLAQRQTALTSATTSVDTTRTASVQQIANVTQSVQAIFSGTATPAELQTALQSYATQQVQLESSLRDMAAAQQSKKETLRSALSLIS